MKNISKMIALALLASFACSSADAQIHRRRHRVIRHRRHHHPVVVVHHHR